VTCPAADSLGLSHEWQLAEPDRQAATVIVNTAVALPGAGVVPVSGFSVARSQREIAALATAELPS
jgi:hypothetical protein